ncbi:MAG: DUF5677 domain-containing protein [Bacteroidetes bacterium]|nr:DUF5677 domain-containing protein [Bacteroidota bacterium]MCL5737864.1 DUF5677 domain-containing protein [Bacteroidota bacterium]
MTRIQKLLEIDERIFSTIDSRMEEVQQSLTRTDEPHIALYLIWRFAVKIGGMKESTKMLFTEGDPYSARILARSIIDHYYKLLYFCIRHSTEKNDDVADEYLTYCDISEYLEYYKPLDSKSTKEKEEQDKAWNLLLQMNPDLGNADRNKSITISKKFRLREIARYVDSVLPKGAGNKTLSKEKDIVPTYSFLSSFVHGGAFAEKYYSPLRSKDQNVEEDDYTILHESIGYSYSAIELMFMSFALTDEKLFTYATDLKNEMIALVDP